MKNWTQVVWGCYRHLFRPLFYGIVQPKLLLSFGIFFSIFFPHRGSVAISSCSCMKTTGDSFDSFGAMTFLLKNQNQKKAKKLETRHKYWFTHLISCMQNRTPFAAAAATPRIWICSFRHQKKKKKSCMQRKPQLHVCVCCGSFLAWLASVGLCADWCLSMLSPFCGKNFTLAFCWM